MGVRWFGGAVRWSGVAVQWSGVAVRWSGVGVRWSGGAVRWSGVAVQWSEVAVRWSGVFDDNHVIQSLTDCGCMKKAGVKKLLNGVNHHSKKAEKNKF